MLYSRTFIISIFCSLTMSACGGASDSAPTEPEIFSVSLRDKTVAPNANGQARIEFLVPARFMGYDGAGEAQYAPNGMSLVVFIPTGTSYVPGTSKLADSLFGDVLFGTPERREPNRIGRCSDDSTFLEYDFQGTDFPDPDSVDAMSLFLKLDFSVTVKANGLPVAAGAQSTIPTVPCTIHPDQSAKLIVAN